MQSSDWKQLSDGSWQDPDGWVLNYQAYMSLVSKFPAMLKRLVEKGGAEWTRLNGLLPGLRAPLQPTSRLSDIRTVTDKKQAPTDEQVYKFFATCSAPGCCPKCSAPCPCSYHPNARPVTP